MFIEHRGEFCYKYYCDCFIHIQGQLVWNKTFTHLRENFDSKPNSSKFLPGIMYLMVQIKDAAFL
jgi:hypothetical protein